MSMESQLKLHSISAASQQNTRSEMGTWTWPEVEGVNNIFSNQDLRAAGECDEARWAVCYFLPMF